MNDKYWTVQDVAKLLHYGDPDDLEEQARAVGKWFRIVRRIYIGEHMRRHKDEY